ncbi:MAG: MFS transporter [Bacteroidota bacterium]
MRGNKILYSFGNLSAAVSNQAFMTYITFFYVDAIKFPKAYFGLAWLFFGLWNAVNDPLFGQWSDRTRTRWGRRLPFMAVGALPYALFFFLLWVPPAQHLTERTLFYYLLGSMFLFDTFFTLVILNWTALFPEMYPSLAERASVSAWRQVFGLIGLVLGMAVPPLLYGRYGWALMGLALALVTLATTILSILGSEEHPQPRPGGVGLLAALRFTFTSRSFLAFAAANFGNYLAMGTVQATFAFFVKYVLRAADQAQSLLMGTAFAVTLPMLALWRRVTIRYGARLAQIATAAVFGLVCLGFLVVDDLTGALIVSGLLGIGLAGVMMLPDILIADVVDEDELRSGERREGMFFGVGGLAIRLAGALQGLVIMGVLGAFGYDANAAVQTAAAIRGIRVLMSVVPLLAMALTAGAMYLYPLHGRRLAEVKKALSVSE